MFLYNFQVENDNSSVGGLLDFDEPINIEEPIPKSNIKLNGVRVRTLEYFM